MTRDATACEMLLEDINYMSCTISSMQYEIWKERNLFLSSVFLDAKKFGDLTFLLLISDWLIIIPSKRHSAILPLPSVTQLTFSSVAQGLLLLRNWWQK